MKKHFLISALILSALFVTGQDLKIDSNRFQPPVNFNTQQDHENMMQQLGIKSLRPGFSGNENDPNHANYDESLANPCPQLPDALTLNNGKKVNSAEIWWNQRRPEIAALFEREVYGRLPSKI